MKTDEMRPFDPAELLNTPEARAFYLNEIMGEVIETNDYSELVRALGVIARAEGMSDIARKTGRGRQSLYKALDGSTDPSVGTFLKVLHATGLRLSVSPVPMDPTPVS